MGMEPFVFDAPHEDEDAREEARRILERAGVPDALSGMHAPDALEPAARAPSVGDTLDAVPPPEPPTSGQRLDAERVRIGNEATDAQAIGDAYRAQLAQRAQPPAPPAAPPSAAATPQAAPSMLPPYMQGSPSAAAAQLRAPASPDPDLEVHGYADDSAPTLPGRVRSRAAPSLIPETAPTRAQLLPLLRARQAQAAPSSAPAGAGASVAGPPAPDFTGADVSDAIRRPLHALGAALQVAGGVRPTPFRSERQVAEERFARQQALAQRLAAGQQQSELAQQRVGLERERLGIQRADRDRAASLQERTLQLREALEGRRAAAYERNAASLDAQRQAQLARYATDAERQAAVDEPSSIVSRQSQTAMRFRLAALPPAARERVIAGLGLAEGEDLDEHINGMSDAAIRQALGGLASDTRDITNRRGGAQGGGGGAGASATREALDARARAAGLSDQMIASYGNDRRRLLAETERRERAAASGAESAEGVEIVPGVRTRMDVSDSEVRAMREGIETAQTQSANLRGLDRIHERFGGLGTRISPEAQQRIRPRLTIARGMVAELGRTGVINPGEIGTINAALPDPNSLTQMTFGTFNAALEEWQRLLDESVRAKLGVRGVDDAGIERVLRAIHGNSWSGGGSGGQQRPAAPAAPASDMVTVTNGTRRIRLPRAQYEQRRTEIERDGYRLEGGGQ